MSWKQIKIEKKMKEKERENERGEVKKCHKLTLSRSWKTTYKGYSQKIKNKNKSANHNIIGYLTVLYIVI